MVRGMIADEIECASKEEWSYYHTLKRNWRLFLASRRARSVYGKSIAGLKNAFDTTIALGQPILVDIYGFSPPDNAKEVDDSNNASHPEDQRYQMAPLDKEEDPLVSVVRPEDEDLVQLLNASKCVHYISRFFITKRGYIGRGPITTKKGDPIVAFLGAKIPYILRKVQGTDQYRILGECCKLPRNIPKLFLIRQIH